MIDEANGVSLDKSSPAPEEWLRRLDMLPFDVIFNVMHGRPASCWPKTNERFVLDWKEFKKRLYPQLRTYALKNRMVHRIELRRIAEAVAYCELLAFCDRWDEARDGAAGTTIPPSSHTDAEPQPDPYRSGLPGRPSIAHLVYAEMERRAAADGLLLSLKKECDYLAAWAAKEHPQAPPIKPNTLKNRLRHRYRELMGYKSPK